MFPKPAAAMVEIPRVTPILVSMYSPYSVRKKPNLTIEEQKTSDEVVNFLTEPCKQSRKFGVQRTIMLTYYTYHNDIVQKSKSNERQSILIADCRKQHFLNLHTSHDQFHAILHNLSWFHEGGSLSLSIFSSLCLFISSIAFSK